MNNKISTFYDEIATDYDDMMELGFISQLISRAFQKKLVRWFTGDKKVLDIGCGSGKDALFLGSRGEKVHGFDISPGMIKVATQKALLAGLSEKVTFSVGDANHLDALHYGRFEGAYSNFNALNHLSSLSNFAKDLSDQLAPGAVIVLTIMNRVCLSEIIGYVLRLRFAAAFRKMRSRQSTLSASMQLYFPKEAAAAFEPFFKLEAIDAFGLLVPPAQLYSGKSFRRFFNILAMLEQPLLRIFPFYNFCDIYILTLKKNEL
jgi:ubiquinone/menaquinone biosynthesis C-methylase UbiE